MTTPTSYCPACLTGRCAACHTYRAPAGAASGFGKSGGGHGGAVSDLLAVPCAGYLPITAQANVPAQVLCTLPDNAVDGYRSVAPHPKARPGADVLVVGAAGLSAGRYAVAAAVIFGPRPSLPLLEMYAKGITVHLSRADSRRYAPELADLAASGRFRAHAVTTRVAERDDAPAAWLTPATKLVLVRD